MQSAPGGISSPLVRAFDVIERSAGRGGIPLRPGAAAESGRQDRFSRAHLPAFAVIEPLADRGSIPVRRDPAAPFPNKTIYRLFLEKHREFI